jgi:hypothetical protein
MKPLPDDPVFFQRLFALDEEVFREMKKHPCKKCGGSLDTANIPRKLRGKPEVEGTIRFGLCCRSCRKRVWPPSVRFLGRKVYSAWTILLAVDFYKALGLKNPIARRTLARWRNLWRERLSEGSSFMRWARAQGNLPIPQPGQSPGAILTVFGFPDPSSWIPALKFFTQFSNHPA